MEPPDDPDKTGIRTYCSFFSLCSWHILHKYNDASSHCVPLRNILFKIFCECRQKAVRLLFQPLFTQIPVFLDFCDKLFINHVQTPLYDIRYQLS